MNRTYHRTNLIYFLMPIPTECPECSSVSVAVKRVPPDNHNEGPDWRIQAECTACDAYTEWFH